MVWPGPGPVPSTGYVGARAGQPPGPEPLRVRYQQPADMHRPQRPLAGDGLGHRQHRLGYPRDSAGPWEFMELGCALMSLVN